MHYSLSDGGADWLARVLEPSAGKKSRLRGQRIHKNPPTKISQTDCAATEDKESQESGPCSARGVLAGVSRRCYLRRPGPVQGRCWRLGPMPSQLRDLSRVGGSGKKGWILGIPGIPLRRNGSGGKTAVDPLGFFGLRRGSFPPASRQRYALAPFCRLQATPKQPQCPPREEAAGLPEPAK